MALKEHNMTDDCFLLWQQTLVLLLLHNPNPNPYLIQNIINNIFQNEGYWYIENYLECWYIGYVELSYFHYWDNERKGTLSYICPFYPNTGVLWFTTSSKYRVRKPCLYGVKTNFTWELIGNQLERTYTSSYAIIRRR